MIEFTGNIQVHRPTPCPDNCVCHEEDAMTTPLDLEDIE